MNPEAWATALPAKCVPGPAHAVHGPDRIARNGYTAPGELEKLRRRSAPRSPRSMRCTYSPNCKATSITDANGNMR